MAPFEEFSIENLHRLTLNCIKKTYKSTNVAKLEHNLDTILPITSMLLVQLIQEVDHLAGDGHTLDFPAFLRLMRWLLDTHFLE